MKTQAPDYIISPRNGSLVADMKRVIALGDRFNFMY